MLEGTECTAAWCSVDNWQPLTCGVYFYGELKGSNKEQWVCCIVKGEPNYINFSINYLIRTMCLLSGVLRNKKGSSLKLGSSYRTSIWIRRSCWAWEEWVEESWEMSACLLLDGFLEGMLFADVLLNCADTHYLKV